MRTHDDIANWNSPRRLAIAGAAVLLGAVLALAGCAVGPKFEPPAMPLVANWGSAADSLAVRPGGTGHHVVAGVSGPGAR